MNHTIENIADLLIVARGNMNVASKDITMYENIIKELKSQIFINKDFIHKYEEARPRD